MTALPPSTSPMPPEVGQPWDLVVPSRSVSTDDCTMTTWRIASVYENTGWVSPPETLMDGRGVAPALGATATVRAAAMDEARIPRQCETGTPYLLGLRAQSLAADG